jgi:imidazolonepropionase-like amidohydrolase
MVVNGVTATRLMMGTPEQLSLRRDVASGRTVGPQLWLASPEFAGRAYGDEFHGYAVSTPDVARTAVREAADAGYDFIKLTLFVQPPAYAVVVDEAAKRGIPVVGHVDARVGVARALAAGQHIEHLDNYLESVLADSAPMKASVSDRGVFTPYQALAAATRTPAEFLHAAGEWGTVQPGKRADLVLLSANPLEDIRNTTKIEAVSVGGRWLTRAALDRMLTTAIQRLSAPPAGPDGAPAAAP